MTANATGPLAEGDLWAVVDAALGGHDDVIIRVFEREGGPVSGGRIGCSCGVEELPADEDDIIPGGRSWRRHRAEAVLSALAAADADADGDDEEILLRSMGPAPEGGFAVELEPSRRLMQALGGALADLLEKEAGINYVEWQVKPAGQAEPYTLYCIRPGGKTPHQLRLEAEYERERLRGRIERVLGRHDNLATLCEADEYELREAIRVREAPGG